MNRRASLALAAALAVGVAPRGAAQGAARGFELERLGRPAEAAAAYLATLARAPADEPALLGLERVLPGLDRTAELLAAARRARAADPASALVRGVELRALAELGALDSVALAGAAWAVAHPGSEDPYQEWALALADRGRLDGARRVVREGRRALGRGDALAAVAADIEERAGDWVAAAREWRGVVAADPGQRVNAGHHLADAPLDQRDGVLAALAAGGAPPVARRVAAELLVAWSRPLEGWRLLEGALDGQPAERAAALRDFAQRAEAMPGADARRARGLALAAYADVAPPALAARARAEAARALLDGGDRAGARAQLTRLTRTAGVTGDTRALAEAALIELLIEDGALAEAEARLDAAGDSSLSGEDAQSLRQALARGHLRQGDLHRAASLLGPDSSVAAAAIRGWIALFGGDLATADSLFRRAGPYAGDRADATARTAMLALVQTIAEPSAPALGDALRTLARGDSSAAVGALQGAARALGPGSRAGVLVLAGRVAAREGGDAALALALLAEAVRLDAAGAFAPEAELLTARLLLRRGRAAEGIALLEHLILTYPRSAFTPEARRELERARGAIPRS